MARDTAQNLIHHIKKGRSNSEIVNDLSMAYLSIELGFSQSDKDNYRRLYEWALLGYSGYNPLVGQLLSRSDASLLKNQAVEAIALLETSIDRLALFKALDMEEDSMMMQDAKYWLEEALEYVAIISQKILLVRGLEENVMKVSSGINVGESEQAALDYQHSLEENEKRLQAHMGTISLKKDSIIYDAEIDDGK
ncbi:hypothetical protein IJG79_01685 [Candidatus Saccharibacteria bacterium]|nr:hypothetical protein [Candidatus Saccharibacteria bacterium]